MFWTTVPETSINEHANLCFSEHNVCFTAYTLNRFSIYPETQPHPVQCATQFLFWNGITRRSSLHHSAHPWRGCHRCSGADRLSQGCYLLYHQALRRDYSLQFLIHVEQFEAFLLLWRYRFCHRTSWLRTLEVSWVLLE